MNEIEMKTIKQAIINEVEGHEFYKIAAENAPTAEAKSAFLELAGEELQHITWLKELFNAIKNEATDTFKMANVIEAHSPNLFNWENVDRKTAQLALSVYGIGIQMERSAVEFYKKASNEAAIPEVKELFRMLAGWEQVHMIQFSDQYETLKEQWWNHQEFAPF